MQNNKYDYIIELDDEIRRYTSLILKSVNLTYSAIFPEKHDIQRIINYLNEDKILINEAEDFYKEHDELSRNEVDDFFKVCHEYISSVEAFISSKKISGISELKIHCKICVDDIISSVKGTILEDKEVLSELITSMELNNSLS